MNIYLDIDGVLLGKQNGIIKLAAFAEEFIDLITNKYECYWLTTHCKGNTEQPLTYLKKYCSTTMYKKLKQINPTTFTTLKTEALDINSDFIWIDDYILQCEFDFLLANNKANSWFQVNTYNDFYALKSIINYLNIYSNQQQNIQ